MTPCASPEAVRLGLQQVVQGVEACRVSGRSVHAIDCLRYVTCDGGFLLSQSFEPRFCDLLLSMAFGNPFGLLFGVGREIFERAEDAEKLVQTRTVGAQLDGQRLDREAQHARRTPRIDRQLLVEISEDERAAAELESQLAAVEHAAVLVAEDRQQQLRMKLGFERVPVDVKELRRLRAGAVLEHVGPPRVSASTDSHVVRHKVDDVRHPGASDCGAETAMGVFASKLRVDLVVVPDVVPVRAAGSCREIRRGVAGADPQSLQIWNYAGRVAQSERGVQLEAVHRNGNMRRTITVRRRRHLLSIISQGTDCGLAIGD